MAKPTVLVTRAIPQAALDLLAIHATVDANGAETGYSPQELISHAQAADAIVSLLTDRIDAVTFAACPKLKVVANVAVGYDNIDVAAAAKAGVVVTNTPGVLTDATADFAWALLLAAAHALASVVTDAELNPTYIVPSVFHPDVTAVVAAAVAEAAQGQ